MLRFSQLIDSSAPKPVGLLTRLAAIPLIIDMIVAIASTKVPILLGRGYWLFADPSVTKTGLWSMLHQTQASEAR